MWNGKVRCISTDGTWKVGETYCILNGSIQFASGRFSHNKFLSLEDVNDFFNSKFELVQTPKELLKSGDKVTYRDGSERFVLLETGTLHNSSGTVAIILDKFDDNLMRTSETRTCDIMKIERGSEIIWEREEKSAKQIEVENIKNEMKKLADRLEQVEKEL